MWTTIIYLLLAVLILLFYLLVPKRECFTVVLKDGTSYEGHINYSGKRSQHDLKREIVAHIECQGVQQSEIVRILLG